MSKRIRTPHSDENPELSPEADSTGEPLAAYSTEGKPSDALSQKEGESGKKLFNYVLQPGETILYEDTYIPPSEE